MVAKERILHVGNIDRIINHDNRMSLLNQSIAYVDGLTKSIGEMSLEEQELVRRIQSLHFGFYHRLKPKNLQFCLRENGIYTLDQSQNAGSYSSATPLSEQHLFNASHYIFGWVGFWPATNKFGEVIMEIKQPYWERCSWATPRSGYEYYMIGENANRRRHQKPPLTDAELIYTRYDNPSPEQVKDAQRELLREIILPEHYRAASALSIIGLLRFQEDIDTTNLLATPDAGLRAQLVNVVQEKYVDGRRKVGFFEGKIRDNVPLSEIEQVLIPKSVVDHYDIVSGLQAKNIVYKIVDG